MDSQNVTSETPSPSVRDDASTGSGPSSRRRRVLQAAAPVALIVIITAAMRFVAGNEAAESGYGMAAKSAAVSGAPKGALPADGLSATPQPSRLADAVTAKKITEVVGKQLAAIQNGDFKTALEYSTPEMRDHTTPETFEMIISRGYHPMQQAAKVEFGQVRVAGDSAMLTVILKPKSDAQTLYRYILTSLGDRGKQSAWYITGVSEDVIPGFGGPNYPIPGPPPGAGRRPMPRPEF